MATKQNELRLLPFAFKKIAIGAILLIGLFLLLALSNILPVNKDVAKTIFKIGVPLALLVLTLTRNKVEDELTLHIRVKAFAYTFVFGVIFVTLRTIADTLFPDDSITKMGLTDFLVLMFVDYFINFY